MFDVWSFLHVLDWVHGNWLKGQFFTFFDSDCCAECTMWRRCSRGSFSTHTARHNSQVGSGFVYVETGTIRNHVWAFGLTCGLFSQVCFLLSCSSCSLVDPLSYAFGHWGRYALAWVSVWLATLKLATIYCFLVVAFFMQLASIKCFNCKKRRGIS